MKKKRKRKKGRMGDGGRIHVNSKGKIPST